MSTTPLPPQPGPMDPDPSRCLFCRHHSRHRATHSPDRWARSETAEAPDRARPGRSIIALATVAVALVAGYLLRRLTSN